MKHKILLFALLSISTFLQVNGQYSINYMSTTNGAIVGDGTTNTDYFGPNDYGGNYGDCTSGNWEWIQALCSECSINDIDVSVKQNNNGSTWYAGSGASRYMVIDLSMPRTFNELRIFQMFSDGKVTSLRMYSHSNTTTAPFYSDPGWIPVFAETPINAGMIVGNTVSLPTVINFPYTTSRFLLIEAKNDGSLGNPSYTEIRELKLFDNNSSDPAPIDIYPLVDTIDSQNACVSYTLPILINGNYFTGTNGTGTPLFAGDNITMTQTIYIYADNGTCTNESSFTVTIIDDVTNPLTPTLADVTGEYTATATVPITTDNCAGTITGTTIDPLTYTTEGTHIITWTFDDGNGNSIEVEQNVIINDVTNIDYMHFFTPNGNGENDYWQILEAKRVMPNTKINIFDRFGKLVAQIDPDGMGWDGMYNGKALPSSDYWFSLQTIDGTEMRGNFSLLRN